MTITKRQFLGPISIQRINPPVLGTRSCAAEVEAPAAIGPDDRGTLQRRGAEGLAAHLAYRLEVDPIYRLRDDYTHAAARVEGSSDPVRQPENAVHQNAAGTAGPVPGTSVRCRDDNLSAGISRKINIDRSSHGTKPSRIVGNRRRISFTR
jgi:hypothetical protein